ncbi:iron chelate uptake ABC transporter family permease subunit [Hoyosella sp. G463]|uniref:Iron chelate uptake ABC transporter family permease subunit n=1 Tax=Lolliginicoccus lacisalsi TaxID=2742202 RepID=A0A927JF55_9ACTN|nr:iron ABC transporter permease [Lolliginicoccus lacisalsi]MBD8507627.1 iron chelate uptake ABC transporter family permease subunit [Lolliginicoccus lacisalsi]
MSAAADHAALPRARTSGPDHLGRQAPLDPRAPWWRHLSAHAIDALIVAAPLTLGLLIISSLSDQSGGGQADRAVFAIFTAAATLGLAWWNLGARDGTRGQSLGKSAALLITRDTRTGRPLGPRRALARRLTLGRAGGPAETLDEPAALAEGFEPDQQAPTIAELRRRRLLGLAALAITLVFMAFASIAIGARPLALLEIQNALLSPSGADTDIIVRSLRVPRTLLAITVGIAIGVAGALIQGHTRNPLADPGILGVIPGAAFAVVLAVYLFRLGSPSEYVWFAFLGAFLTTIVVFGIASIGKGGASPLTLPLAGVAVGAFLTAMTNAVVLLDRASLDAYRFWNVGSVAGRGLDVLLQVLPFIIVGLAIARASTPGLNLLSLGDDMARSLGTNIALTRVAGILAITLLAGAATAACGVIAFLGLVVPHIARAITGPDYKWIVPFSGLCGAILILSADVLGRIVVRPSELQLGIVLALVGGPFFIALVRRRKLVSL